MKTTNLSYLFEVSPPWVYVGSGEPERRTWIPSYFYSQENSSTCVRLLRGHKMQTTDALMNEFAAALQFFEGFGENWYALEECLQYLDEWLPADAYILVIERADKLLKKSATSELTTFLKVLQAVGESWSHPISNNDRFDRPAIPFHVLLHSSDPTNGELTRILSAARMANVSVRS